jgi:uncharacterized lipoprotein YehR (DUF1307 family)
MRRLFLLVTVFSVVALFSACGSKESTTQDNQMQEGMQNSGSMGMSGENAQMESKDEWVRSEPIDVKALDVNGDGYVYQDPMDWNVIADQEGKCPKCGMTLKKVTVEQAEQNLKDNGFKVTTNG